MGMYQHMADTWKNPRENLGKLFQQRMIEWTDGPATVRVERPTRIDRARALGYRAKPGILVVRERLAKSARMRSKHLRSGRRPKHNRLVKIVDKNFQNIAEERVARQYPNCEVLNSYWVGATGKHKFFEVILVDREHPAIKADPQLRWITEKSGRAFRGLTSSGKKHRGMRIKGFGAEKARPSVRAMRKVNDTTGRRP